MVLHVLDLLAQFARPILVGHVAMVGRILVDHRVHHLEPRGKIRTLPLPNVFDHDARASLQRGQARRRQRWTLQSELAADTLRVVGVRRVWRRRSTYALSTCGSTFVLSTSLYLLCTTMEVGANSDKARQ